MRAAFLAIALVAIACSSPDLGPAVTCPDVKLLTANGSCDLDATGQVCSDGNLYAIDCQDDSTCGCNVNVDTHAIVASSATSGFCATVDATKFHELAVKCGWNLNP